MTTMARENQEVDLLELGYMFATSRIDPKVGRLVANQVTWTEGSDKVVTPIELINCSELKSEMSQGKAALAFANLVKGRIEADFLCPKFLNGTMSTQGDYGSEQFNYI